MAGGYVNLFVIPGVSGIKEQILVEGDVGRVGCRRGFCDLVRPVGAGPVDHRLLISD